MAAMSVAMMAVMVLLDLMVMILKGAVLVEAWQILLKGVSELEVLD